MPRTPMFAGISTIVARDRPRRPYPPHTPDPETRENMSINVDQQVIEEFRANRGRVGGPYEGRRLLLLTTTGTGAGGPRTTPIVYLPDGERMLVLASAEGASSHPAWFRDLLARPRVTVEAGPLTLDAVAVVLEGEERDRLFARVAQVEPLWAEQQAGAARTLPVVALNPLGGGPPPEPMGDSLKTVHGLLRRELALLREEVARSGTGLMAQLRVNCLTFCQGLHHHHALEDARVFPFLDARHPELAAVLARLREEHRTVKRILDELQALISDEATDPAELLAGVERLTADLEAHLDHEERELVPILNALAP
ncbi:nitroreductase/quinone reductase family protein [Thermomonospora umbrina]|uniref:Deazaflavin-dependent oxidoreductase (Nitroreductase family) n=1 Tax=Thermomonospora umbrina TaxID=111806 RepID=A0A3D9SYE4_9ACTN|nr:nitroreductase/quinone reductase family protein [Thermomonospora umbrina]REF00869.1 deazaflavin-dependent oxidoreductase (nitroreductase family) [Thermomonospora umbrina]